MRNTPASTFSVSGIGIVNSVWYPADQWFSFSAIALGTGTIAGTMKVQVSNDSVDSKQADIVAFDLAGVTVALVALKGVIPKLDSAYNWVRLVFTSSGGAGAITMRLKASGV